MYTASFLKPVSYVNLYCHKNCHIFTQFTIKYNCIMHLCWHRVLYSTIHTLLLPTPLPQISHGFSLCCFLQEESWICSAIQIARTWEWLFWGKTQVCLDRIMSQSSQKQWFREEPHIRTTLKYQRNSLKADSGSQQSVAQRLKYEKRLRELAGIWWTGKKNFRWNISEGGNMFPHHTTAFHPTVSLATGIVFCPPNVLFSIWTRWQKWNCFPSFLIKPPSDWSWPPVPIPLDETNLFLLPH